ncbi:Mdm33 family-domain-containing protein [Clohesyomyces aquaticus]|uniref:Sensitive to high expression protein 9, mitochondrial n=1 Tax=Clohesyomyces aquaticus TaxID=1231657 RepID=A0A1Y1YFZ1_9PLEO|nr:Mdm33 family-domain-containing protein [Clohesyomyces aquaticus]
MRPLLQNASRSLLASSAFVAPPRSTSTFLRSFVSSASKQPSICLQCQFRASSVAARQASRQQFAAKLLLQNLTRRIFHSSRVLLDKDKPIGPPEASSEETNPPIPSIIPNKAPLPSKPGSSPPADDTIERVPAEDLPSHRDKQRWDLSKRFNAFMDDLLPKLAVVGQKVNTYTGTDYSGIEALRREIKEQEKLVKNRRLAVDEAKQALDAAHAQQASSAKEVVGLLERKHSWSATDLERYMQLIRSEHVNDQAVQAAKDNVQAAESILEEARTQLEKRERAQYHEEQIWSDTIRRNSTWVTFGLMGFNIFLLLFSLVLIEPWRRRRLVKEVKKALEAQKTATESATAFYSTPAVTAAIDRIVEPAEELVDTTPSAPKVVEATLIQKAEPEGFVTSSEGTTQLTPDEMEAVGLAAFEPDSQEEEPPMTWQESIVYGLSGFVSDQYVYIRRKDFSMAVSGAAAAGAITSWFLLNLLRPNR